MGGAKYEKYIPGTLSTDEQDVYLTILKAVEKRKGVPAPRIVVITDLAKDFDDLLAMIVLKELHRLGAIELLAFVANLEPAVDRARLGRGALNELGLRNIPIGIGTSGLGPNHKHQMHEYEFAGSETFIAETAEGLLDGQALLLETFQRAKEQGYKITLLTLSSLMDIAKFMKDHRELLADRLERCVLQGGYIITENKELVPDMAATNNNFSPEDAQDFHKFLFEYKVPTTCFTKVATFATPIYQNLLTEMAKTKLAVGMYLKSVQLGQDMYFWECASGPRENRFRDFMDKEWFLHNKTTWYSEDRLTNYPHAAEPVGAGIEKWLDKLTAYDCLAAVGTAQDVLEALNVVKPLEKRKDAIHDIHQTVGVLPKPNPRMIDKPKPKELSEKVAESRNSAATTEQNGAANSEATETASSSGATNAAEAVRPPVTRVTRSATAKKNALIAATSDGVDATKGERTGVGSSGEAAAGVPAKPEKIVHAEDDKEENLDGIRFALVIRALALGSLLAVTMNLPTARF